jgi:hypothetical protein
MRTLEEYFYEQDDVLSYIPTDIENERRNRIRLSLFAYAYEYEDDSLISDVEYDKLSYMIRKDIKTGNKLMDKFFNRQFLPHTGQWIHKHPEIDKLKAMYYVIKNKGPHIRYGAIVFNYQKSEVVYNGTCQ